MSHTTLTKTNETWDQIALRELGDERLMNLIMDANFKHQNVVFFDANTELIIPDIPYTELANQNLPPWKNQ